MIEWEVDERPPSVFTRLYVRGMWLRRDKRAFQGAGRTLRRARREQESGDHPPTLFTRLRTRTSESGHGGLAVWTARPRRGGTRLRVLYVHGGGYVHPLTGDYWRLVRSLTTAPAEVVVPGYPLAPDRTLDDVLPQLLRLYDDLVASQPPLPVVLMGDSAGGALVISMALRLRDLQAPPPAAVVALSPWLDASLADREVADLEATDPMLEESGLRAAGRWWAGNRGPDDPLVSPVAARLSGLPPIDLYIGDRDILRPAVDTFAEHARRDGAVLHVREVTAMFHVWMTRFIPEGRRTRKDLVRLLRRRAS